MQIVLRNTVSQCLVKDIMNKITVTVQGLGGTIAYEMVIIRRALEAAGINVEVNDIDPINESEESEDEFIERMKTLNHSKTQIKLIAKHIPWGG